MNEKDLDKRINQSRIDHAVYSTIGHENRLARFVAGERPTIEQVIEKYGVYEKCCGDCGLKPKTQLDDGQYQLVMRDLENATDGIVPYSPFFCHREMEQPRPGCWLPVLNTDVESQDCGLPVGVKLCVGWVVKAKRLNKV